MGTLVSKQNGEERIRFRGIFEFECLCLRVSGSEASDSYTWGYEDRHHGGIFRPHGQSEGFGRH
jgi:hypothetical protein